MKINFFVMPAALVTSALVIAIAITISANILSPETDFKSDAVNDCIAASQEIEERGDEEDGWKVSTQKVEKETYTFCMSEKGYQDQE